MVFRPNFVRKEKFQRKEILIIEGLPKQDQYFQRREYKISLALEEMKEGQCSDKKLMRKRLKPRLRLACFYFTLIVSEGHKL